MAYEKRNFHTLDGMRGVAAISVLVYHAHWMVPTGYWQESYLAVDVFFALSGFVLAHAYAHKLDRGMSVFEFMRIRAVRLYPLYLVGALIGLTVGWTHFQQTRTTSSLLELVVASLGGLPGSIPWRHPGASLYPADPAAWSLFFEMIANLALVLAWKRLTKQILMFALSLGAFGIVTMAFSHGSLSGGFNWDGFFTGTARVLYSFSVGVAIQRWGLRAPRIPAWAVIGLMLALFAIPIATRWNALYDSVAVILGVPVVVLFGCSTEPVQGMRFCRFAGLTSYAVYITHQPLTHLLMPIAQTYPDFSPDALVIVFTAAVVVLAALLDRFYDLPVRRFLMNRTARRSSGTLAKQKA